jgi:molybdopterin synthase sulfur carrier subunit
VTVEVLYFASLAETTGRSRETVEVAEDADVGSLWTAIVTRYPEAGELGYKPMVACDMEYAEWDAPLRGVREVAFLPPVSGG